MASINFINAGDGIKEELTVDPFADFEEADMLIKKSLRIVKRLYSPASDKLKFGLEQLVSFIHMKKDFMEESQSLLQDYLSDNIKYKGIDGENTDLAHINLGQFHHRTTPLLDCIDEKRRYLQISALRYT